MAPKKGLSKEQKREKILELLHETKEVFQLKDIEKLAPRKGVIQQSVKEAVTSLASDEMINQAKIGTSTYYWSFPSQLDNQLVQLEKRLDAEVAQLKAKRDDLMMTHSELEGGQQESEEELNKLQEKVNALRKLEEKLDETIASMNDCDPELKKKYDEDEEVALEAVERWTSNVVNLRQYLMQKGNFEEREINKQFGLKDDFEDIEF